MSVIISTDLSLTGTGIVVLEDGKIIEQRLIKSKPKKDEKPVDELVRILWIVDEIKLIFTGYSPKLAVIENLAFGISKTSSLTQLAALNYFTRDLFFKNDIPFVLVAPTSLKKFITGSGNSKKDVMMLEVYKRYGVSITNDNENDAFCLAKVGEALLGENKDELTKFQEEVIETLKKQLT